MTYSNFYNGFALNLNYYYNIIKQDVLDHPENYLGPNYKELLNFWVYWDSLSEEQWVVYWDKRDKLGEQTRLKARKLAKEVIDPRFVKYFWDDELEIISAHLYLERDIPFTFLPLLFDL
jgi:hypothetical protein